MSWIYFQDAWALNHKCTFDGENRLIIVGPNTSTLSIKTDVYSDWKEWLTSYDNAKWLPAVRVSGGDPIGGGAYTGDVYFLINGWRILIDHSCAIDGVIYSDDFPSPFVQVSGTQIVTNKVSSLVSVIAPQISGITVPTASENALATWSASNRTLTNSLSLSDIETSTVLAKQSTLTAVQTSVNNIPTAVQIREEIDLNSTQLISAAQQHTAILNAIGNISVSSAAVNTPANGFVLTSGVVNSGSYSVTANLDHVYHVIYDNANQFDVEYTFDIGLDSVPSEFTFIGRAWESRETLIIMAWNYVSLIWDTVLTVPGKNQTTDSNYSATLFGRHSGILPGQIGDVRIRMVSAVASDLQVHIDQLYVSYAVVERPTGFSGHAVTATSTTIVIDSNAVMVDNYYAPSLVYVNHGTGSQQYAKVISYTGVTKTLHLELPMAVVLDSTSHITLSPWANSSVSVDSSAIASAVWSTPTAGLSDKTTIGGYITKVLLTIPKFLGLK